MTSWALVAALAALAVAQLLVARRLRAPLGALVMLQVVYWGIAFIVVPAVLLLLSPRPAFADALAEPRLARIGYEEGLQEVLPIVVFGQAVYLIVLAGLAVFGSRPQERNTPRPLVVPALVVVLILGWAFRLAWMAGSSSGVVDALLPLASVAAAAVVLFAPAPAGKWIVVAALSEALWSFGFDSKSPVLAITACLVIRFIWTGLTTRRVLVSALIGVLVFAAFLAIQQQKVDARVNQQVDRAAGRYPAVLQPLLPVLVRFDMLKAVVDSSLVTTPPWQSPADFAIAAIEQTVPRVVLPDKSTVTPGQAWALGVRAQSLGSPSTNVSLAEGVVAEGNALGGPVGVLFEVLVLAAATVGCGALLRARTALARLWGAAILTTPALFERGVLGMLGAGARAFQLAVLCWALYSALRWLASAKQEPASRRVRHVVADLGAAGG